MKKINALLFLCFLAGSTYAQTWDEWFNQKKTQIKYLAQQMVALQMYEGYLSKGYHIAKGGLQSIGRIKSGEFDLHQAFFSSLSQINPSVQHSARVLDIVALQVSIKNQYKKCNQYFIPSAALNHDEVQYIQSVFASLLKNCDGDIEDMILLLSNGALQLSDGERLQRIDAIYKGMMERYKFSQSFTDGINVLITNRQKEKQELTSLQSLYNLE